MRNFTYLLFCGFLLAGQAHAQRPDRLAVPPEGGFQFTGNWDCDGAFGNGKVHRSTFSGAVILDGKWLQLSEQDVEPATGYVAVYLIGYDSQQKRLVEFDANNFGAAIYTSQDGWNKGVLTMTSPIDAGAGAPYAANRFVYSITGPDVFTVEWQISKTPNLNWVQSDRLTCRRHGH